MEAFGGHGVCRPVTVPVGAGIGMKRTLIRSVADGGVGRVWRRGAKGRRISEQDLMKAKAKASLSSQLGKAETYVYGFRPVAVVYVHREDRTSVDVVGGLLVRRSSFVVRRSSFVGDASRTLASGDRRPRVSGAYGAGRPLQQASDNDTDSDTVNDAMRLTCFPFPAPPPSDSSTFVPSTTQLLLPAGFKQFSLPYPTHSPLLPYPLHPNGEYRYRRPRGLLRGDCQSRGSCRRGERGNRDGAGCSSSQRQRRPPSPSPSPSRQ